MHSEQVTIESVIREMRKAYRAAQRSGGKLSLSVIALDREQVFRYDGAKDQWTRL